MGSVGSTLTVNGRSAIVFHISNGKNSAAKRAATPATGSRPRWIKALRPIALHKELKTLRPNLLRREPDLHRLVPRRKESPVPRRCTRAGMGITRQRIACDAAIILSERELTIPSGRKSTGKRRRRGNGADPRGLAAEYSRVDLRQPQAFHITGKQVGQSVVSVTVEGETAVCRVRQEIRRRHGPPAGSGGHRQPVRRRGAGLRRKAGDSAKCEPRAGSARGNRRDRARPTATGVGMSAPLRLISDNRRRLHPLHGARPVEVYSVVMPHREPDGTFLQQRSRADNKVPVRCSRESCEPMRRPESFTIIKMRWASARIS